jgi:hypothetical protein
MKKYYFIFLLLLVTKGITAAIFTLTNYIGRDIDVKIFLDKTWGSKILTVTIPNGRSCPFNTGVYGVKKNGITWSMSGDVSDAYYLEDSISPLSTSLYIQLFKSGTYQFVYKNEWQKLVNGAYPSGWGRIRKI